MSAITLDNHVGGNLRKQFADLAPCADFPSHALKALARRDFVKHDASAKSPQPLKHISVGVGDRNPDMPPTIEDTNQDRPFAVNDASKVSGFGWGHRKNAFLAPILGAGVAGHERQGVAFVAPKMGVCLGGNRGWNSAPAFTQTGWNIGGGWALPSALPAMLVSLDVNVDPAGSSILGHGDFLAATASAQWKIMFCNHGLIIRQFATQRKYGVLGFIGYARR